MIKLRYTKSRKAFIGIIGTLAFVSILLVIAQADNIFTQSGANMSNMSNSNLIFSAEVILIPASGRAIRGEEITANNIKDFAPSPDTIERVRQFFSAADFNVSSVTGISFSITGSRGVFERVFNVRVEADARGSARVLDQAGGVSTEFPLDSLPVSIRSLVTTVTFSRPLDFGPTGNFSQ